jgi:hypothetical protein
MNPAAISGFNVGSILEDEYSLHVILLDFSYVWKKVDTYTDTKTVHPWYDPGWR